MPNAQPQPSPSPDAAIDPDVVLVSSNAAHGGSCGGERIACPVCGEGPYGPSYRPAERQLRRGGVRLIFCHVCGGTWREITPLVAAA